MPWFVPTNGQMMRAAFSHIPSNDPNVVTDILAYLRKLHFSILRWLVRAGVYPLVVIVDKGCEFET